MFPKSTCEKAKVQAGAHHVNTCEKAKVQAGAHHANTKTDVLSAHVYEGWPLKKVQNIAV